MSELRQNIATREWVVIAPERLKGKKLVKTPNPLLNTIPEYEENCPFCPGNEKRFIHIETDVILENNKWTVRGTENKYKIFRKNESVGLKEFKREGIYLHYEGDGEHELVIESTKHNRSFAVMNQNEVENIIEMYLKRFNDLRKNPNNLLTMIFKNNGPLAGASQVHPHSQIVSLRVIPNYLRNLLQEAVRYFDTQGVCVFCKIIEFELKEQKRIVFENNEFAAFVPYAASAPYEVCIIPKKHDSVFRDTTDSEASGLAECLRVVMNKIYSLLSNPDYNLVLRNPPYTLSGVLFYHWHIQVIPRLVRPGGFELGTRMNVNVVSPEKAAQELRDV
jgi:UDPglucose--hexose-1-phosphate uridylyltransferase